MEVYVWGRRTGKTTFCLKYLNGNPNTIMVVATRSMAHCVRQMGSAYRASIITIDNAMPLRKMSVIIDEPDLMDDAKLQDLDAHNKIVFAIGTPVRRAPDAPFSWFARKAMDLGYNHKSSIAGNLWDMGDLSIYAHTITNDEYYTSILAQFLPDAPAVEPKPEHKFCQQCDHMLICKIYQTIRDTIPHTRLYDTSGITNRCKMHSPATW